MKLAKSLLLGSATAFVAVAGANAADLPSKKAAPATYVKVCDAYGAGFYTIPGTDTCIKLYGRVRADFAMSGKQDIYASNIIAPGSGANIVSGAYYGNALTKSATSDSTATSNVFESGSLGAVYTGTKTSAVAGYVTANGIKAAAQNLYGWEARGVISFDARTPTAYGTVQSVAQFQMKRTTGILSEAGNSALGKGMGPQLEAAYVRFAGFTFGAAKDNFSFMPSVFYGAGHWASFANGAKQIAYTAVLGGGISATLAVQDLADTTAGGVNALGALNQYGTSPAANNGLLTGVSYIAAEGASNGTVAYSYNNTPQINGRVDFDQAWGSMSVMGAVSQAVAVNTGDTFNKSKAIWAAGAGVKVNLPMIAAGDTLWLNAGYADGMTEYTTNWTSVKTSDTSRVVGGYVVNHPSWIVGSNGIETVKSWNVAAVMTHYWAPRWRQAFLATYGQIEGTSTSKALAWSQSGAFGDARVWNVGTQVAFLPSKDFEIGVDVLYARVSQDITRLAGTNTAAGSTGSWNVQGASYASSVTRENKGNWTGRLRVERNF